MTVLEAILFVLGGGFVGTILGGVGGHSIGRNDMRIELLTGQASRARHTALHARTELMPVYVDEDGGVPSWVRPGPHTARRDGIPDQRQRRDGWVR